MRQTIDIVKSTKFGLTQKLVSLDLVDSVFKLTIFLDNHYEKPSLNQRYYHIRNDFYYPIECKICHKSAKWNPSKSCYVVCSKECVALQNRNIAKISSTEEKKRKIRQTCLDRYGVDNCFKLTDKIKQTNISRFGAENISLTDSGKQKIAKSLRNIPTARKSLSDTKRRMSCLDRYGVDNPAKSNIFKEKSKNVCIDRYGVENFQQTDVAKIRNIERVEKLFRSNMDQTKFALINYGPQFSKIKCLKCDNIFETSNSQFFDRRYKKIDQCLICHPVGGYNSDAEKQLRDFISSIYDGEIINNSRKIISPYEIDIFLPEIDLAIEYNGLYWHDERQKQDDYHKTKSDNCREKGIHLVHVFEDQWRDQQDIMKSILSNFIGSFHSQTKIYARKCEIRDVSFKEMNDFLEVNHLLGRLQNITKCYGLYYQEELISLMSFKRSRNNDYELSRYTIKNNYAIIGGANRLFQHFLKNNVFSSIITYNDNSVFKGDVYKRLGFKYIRTNREDFKYHDEKFSLRITKQSTRKMRNNYCRNHIDEFLSEYRDRFFRIYDAGKDVYVYKL